MIRHPTPILPAIAHHSCNQPGEGIDSKSYRGKYRGVWTANHSIREHWSNTQKAHKPLIRSTPEATEVLRRNWFPCNS
jgi:hypothetical protein